MMEIPSNKEMPSAKLLKIDWPEGEVAVFANNLLSVSDKDLVYLTFCQIHPPTLIGTEAEKKQQLDQLGALKALPVAKVVVTKEALRNMLNILQEQIDRTDKKDAVE